MSDQPGLSELSAEQLAEALRTAEMELADIEEERLFTLGQTGLHIGGRHVARMRDAWERDEARLRERIASIRSRQSDIEGV